MESYGSSHSRHGACRSVAVDLRFNVSCRKRAAQICGIPVVVVEALKRQAQKNLSGLSAASVVRSIRTNRHEPVCSHSLFKRIALVDRVVMLSWGLIHAAVRMHVGGFQTESRDIAIPGAVERYANIRRIRDGIVGIQMEPPCLLQTARLRK